MNDDLVGLGILIFLFILLYGVLMVGNDDDDWFDHGGW